MSSGCRKRSWTMKPDPVPGFIGIGKMGAPMATRLLDAGHRLLVFNRSRDKLDPLCKAGAEAVESPAALATRADVIMLCLADGAAVEQVVFGADGIAAGGAAGKLLIDFSSIAPRATRDMAAHLEAATGMHWVDAPVSGG